VCEFIHYRNIGLILHFQIIYICEERSKEHRYYLENLIEVIQSAFSHFVTFTCHVVGSCCTMVGSCGWCWLETSWRSGHRYQGQVCKHWTVCISCVYFSVLFFFTHVVSLSF